MKYERRYDIDALRVLAFALLILYHCGMLYVPGWHWHIKSEYEIEALPSIMTFVNAWRMPLIFLVSGVAISLAKPTRNLSKFLKDRFTRLMLPLMIAMIFTVPIQAYIQAVSNGSIEPGIIKFIYQYYTFGAWPDGAFDGSDVGFTWNHLWYLPYLFIYTAILVVLLKLYTAFFDSDLKLTSRFFCIAAFCLFIFVIVLKSVVKPHFPETHALYNDFYAHPYYFSIFLFGYLLGKAETTFWEGLAAKSWVLLAAALITFASLQYSNAASSSILIKNSLVTAYMMVMIASLLGLSFKHLNSPSSLPAKFTVDIFPMYILHQTIIICLAYWLIPLEVGTTLESSVIVSVTYLSCYLATRFLLRPVPWLGKAFGIWR